MGHRPRFFILFRFQNLHPAFIHLILIQFRLLRFIPRSICIHCHNFFTGNRYLYKNKLRIHPIILNPRIFGNIFHWRNVFRFIRIPVRFLNLQRNLSHRKCIGYALFVRKIRHNTACCHYTDYCCCQNNYFYPFLLHSLFLLF